jgi:pimeloyl-ACP methyl ester carboxylesterase
MPKTDTPFLTLITAAFLLVAGITSCSSNRSKNAGSVAAKDSISSLEKITLGRIPQTVLIRGDDTSNPVLLLLHGGPGFPEMLFFRSYNSELEKHYIVVNWDQRGAGLSYDPAIPRTTMNIPQFVSDAHELVTLLKKRFHKEKIYLLGHSWGSVLGLSLANQYPEDLYAYVGVGQVVNMLENERLSFEYTMQKALEEKNGKAIKELKAVEPRFPPDSNMAVKEMLKDLHIQRDWLSYYGGAVYGERSYDKLFQGIHAKEKELYDSSQTAAGETFSMETLWPRLLSVNFIKTAPQLEVPVYFVTGRYDYNTPFVLTQQYFNLMKAPHKELIWFERSAHMMPFEEPEKFNELMIKIKRGHTLR